MLGIGMQIRKPMRWRRQRGKRCSARRDNTGVDRKSGRVGTGGAGRMGHTGRIIGTRVANV